MRAVVQRVIQASVSINDKVVGQIDAGLVVLLGIAVGDDFGKSKILADKIANLRIFGDESGRFNHSVIDIGGEVLVVSQFTLMADARKGRRPSFTDAAPPVVAEPLIDRFVEALRSTGLTVATGQFQQMMLVKIFNDGPVTIILDV